MGLAFTLVLFAFPNTAEAQECESTTLGSICARVVANDVVITLLGQEILRIPAPVREVKVEVPGPRVNIPGPTQTVRIPGPTVTATEEVVAPGATVTIRPGGQDDTPRVTVDPSSRASGSGSSSEEESNQSEPTPTATETETIETEGPAKTNTKTKTIEVSVPQAVGLSIGLLLLGLVLGLLALYTAYAVGYKNSEQSELKAWQQLRSDLFGKR